MAMTLGRWISAVLISCTIVGAALLRAPKAKTGETPSWWLPMAGEQLWRTSTKNELRIANERLRTIELRDSIVPTLATTRYEKGLTVIVDSRLSEIVRRDLAEIVRQQWASIRAKAETHTAVVLLLDTQKVLHGYPRSSIGGMIAVDVAAAGNDCLSIVRVGLQLEELPAKQRNRWRAGLRDRAIASSLIGPCAFVAAYGPPGKGIASWLSSTSWLGARHADWTSRSQPLDKEALYARGTPLDGLTGMQGSWRLRELLSGSAVACIGGRVPECRLALAGRRRDSAGDDRWTHTGIVSSRYVPMNPWFTSGFGGLGPSEGWVLSDMRQELGAVRFEKFWTSGESVDAAFQTASGERIETWLRRWLQRAYGDDTLGPAMSMQTAAVGAGMLIAALGLASLVAMRRRVG